MKYTIVLPTYNEAGNIERMIRSLLALNLAETEILVMDDHSPDGTFRIASGAAAKAPEGSVKVFFNEAGRGLSPSVTSGFALASGEILVCMDADGQHRTEDLPKVLNAFDSPGVALAVGSRHVGGGGFAEKWSFGRILASRGAAFLARSVLRVPLKDPMSGFFAVRKSAFERIRPLLAPKGFKIMLEIAYLLTFLPGAEIVEAPILFAMRKEGESKLSAGVMGEYLAMLARCLFARRRFAEYLSSGRGGLQK